MRKFWMGAALAIVGACSDKGTDTSGGDDTSGSSDSADSGDSGDTSDSADSGDSGDSGAIDCADLPGDEWAWYGECPQMRTPCTIEATGCELAISYPSGMTMGMPYAATVDGTTVTFADGDILAGCTGTLESVDNITGSCEDGCTFTLKRPVTEGEGA